MELEHKIQLYESSCKDLIGMRIADPGNNVSEEGQAHRKRLDPPQQRVVVLVVQIGAIAKRLDRLMMVNTGYNAWLRRCPFLIESISLLLSIDRLNSGCDDQGDGPYSYSSQFSSLKYKNRNNTSMTIRSPSDNSQG